MNPSAEAGKPPQGLGRGEQTPPLRKTDLLTKVLAILGTNLVWFPFVTTILFSGYFFVTEHLLHFDYLIPAELFPFALLGGLLLLWAAVRARSRVPLIGGGLAVAAVTLVGGQVLAAATGLASGAIEPSGWLWALVLGSLVAYSLALVVVAVGGILLLRDLFRPAGPSAQSE